MAKELYAREDLIKVAHQRLVPSITGENYLVLKGRAKIVHAWIEQLPPKKDLMILDIGGRYQPYRPLLESRAKRYVALDIQRTSMVDIVARGEQLPFADNTFDLVIATGVFEFFPQPLEASQGIHRVLKPGGSLIMSVGSVAPRWVDEEHWRFMKAGVCWTLSPFSKIEVVPEVFTIGGLCRTLNTGLSTVAKFELLRKLLKLTLFPLVNLAGLFLESLALSTNDQFAGNYSALARK
jgi:SAM-dependent methyltransferase